MPTVYNECSREPVIGFIVSEYLVQISADDNHHTIVQDAFTLSNGATKIGFSILQLFK
jgi:hypothetical protein